MEFQEITLPVLGLDQDTNATSLETILAGTEGVLQAETNVTEHTISIRYQASQLETCDLAYLVREAGFDVPEVGVTVTVKGMTCVSCIARVEGALREVPGVLEANVNLRASIAELRLIPLITGEIELAHKLEEAGYRLTGLEENC